MAFYNADDGRHAYFVAARDLDHAKQILHAAGVELHDQGGARLPVHHEAVSHQTMWMEIEKLRASKLHLHGKHARWRLIDLREGRYVRVSKAA